MFLHFFFRRDFVLQCSLCFSVVVVALFLIKHPAYMTAQKMEIPTVFKAFN